MRESDYRGKDELLLWNTKYDGSAIYKLTDQDGKVYIGQTKHLQNRMKSHRAAFRRVCKATPQELEERYMGIGQKLVDALRNGKVFRMEMLKAFTEVYEASKQELDYWEDYYLKMYGGVDNTYNIEPTSCSERFYPSYSQSVSWEEYVNEQIKKAEIR